MSGLAIADVVKGKFGRQGRFAWIPATIWPTMGSAVSFIAGAALTSTWRSSPSSFTEMPALAYHLLRALLGSTGPLSVDLLIFGFVLVWAGAWSAAELAWLAGVHFCASESDFGGLSPYMLGARPRMNR